jgi:serine/threonine-protein kinase
MRQDCDCPETKVLERLMLGQLPDAEAEVLERHLSHCDRCDALVDQMSTEDGLVQDMRAGSPILRDSEGPALEHLIGRLRGLQADTPPSPDHWVDQTSITRPEEATEGLEPPLAPGEIGRFGPYRILKILGAGGMGVVYQAWQPRPQRLVALKMTSGKSRTGSERLARFRSEPEIAARLQHPNIVQVFEAGEQADRPYFTMEFVGGGNLAQRLQTVPLSPRAAAELVQILAEALHFAHVRGFVHRDLKPSNILLTSPGDGLANSPSVPKISDFGLAKQVEGEREGAYQTQSNAILGTPAYMAPEQAAGGAGSVGLLADVYALGAILYECLAGRPPFRAATVLETLEQVRTQEPLPPSRLQPGLPRDLQTICLKCLEKDPQRRYGSAQALADDLGRFLRGEAIRAQPVSWAERLRKWARRKPTAAALVLLGGLFALCLTVGVIVHNAQLRGAVTEARRHQERAEANYREGRALAQRMLGRLGEKRLADVPRLKELRQDLLEDTLAFYQALLQGADDPDPAVRLDAAVACENTGDIHYLLGRYQAATDNFRQAVALLERLPPEYRSRPDVQNHLAECCEYLGSQAGDAVSQEERDRYFQRALAIREEIAAAELDNPVWQDQLARAAHNLAGHYLNTGRITEAEFLYDQAEALRTRLIREYPQDDGYRSRLAEDRINLGLLYQKTGRPKEAESTYREAEELLAPLARQHPAEPLYTLSLAGACNNWGNLLKERGELAAALEHENRAVDLAEAVLRREPRHTVARSRAYTGHGSRAQVLEALHLYADAVKDWDRVVELDEKPNPWVNRVLRAVTLARAGEHARATAEALALQGDPQVSGEGLANLVCTFALAIEPARTDTRLTPSERAARAEQYVTCAAALLQKLTARGYFKETRNVQWLLTDPDLKSLRDQENFGKVLLERKGKTR